MKFDKSQKIGKGWQYTVYDLGNGRVYKKFNTRLEAYRIMLKDRWYVFWRFPGYFKEMKKNVEKSFQFLEKNEIDGNLIGNFRRRKGLDYEQDNATPLKDYCKKFSEDKKKECRIVVDRFIKLVNIFYSNYGCMDKAMKFGKNFGIDNNGQVVLIDIGEIWFKPKSVKKRVEERTWSSVENMEGVPKYLRKYYIQELDTIFLDDFKLRD